MPGVAPSLALAAALLAPLVDPPAPDQPLHLGAGWRVATLPKQTKPVTRFSAERIDERAAVRIDADSSYGNLVHDLPAGASARRLRWQWHVALPNPATDLAAKAGDDMAAKVCLSFDLPLASVPFADRALLQFARAQSGELLPAATLCWVWGRNEAHGALVDSPYTRRVRYIVLRNAGDAPGHWFEESRDIAADFHRAFGDEAGDTLPSLLAVIVGGDADNTRVHSVAHVAALHLEP